MVVVSDEKASETQAHEILHLKDRGLMSIEVIVFGFRAHQSIQVLDLSKNMITVIPDCLASFRKLKQLDLSENFIGGFGTALAKLKHLVRLNMTKNQLREVSAMDIYQLYFLKTIILSRNQISGITEDVRHLLNLKVIYLDGNPLHELPTEFYEVKNLKELKLDWGECLQPPHSSSITCTEILDKLQSVPLSSERVSKVRHYLSLQQLFEYMQHLKSSLSKSTLTIAEFILKFNQKNGPVKVKEKMFETIKEGHEGAALYYLSQLDSLKLTEDELLVLLKASIDSKCFLVISELVRLGASPHWSMNIAQETLVHWASDHLNINVLRSIKGRLREEPILDKLGNTPIHKLLQKKNYRTSYFFQGFTNDVKSAQDNLLSANSRFFKSPICSPRGIEGFTSPQSIVESGDYQVEFCKLQVQVMLLLTELGVDPNSFNTAGLCAWHLIIIKENYSLFMLLRNCQFPKSAGIDWELGAYHGTLPMIHLTAKCKDWRFFIECLEGKSKVNVIELDERLLLPLDYLNIYGATITSKVYLRYLKSSLCGHLKTETRNQSDNLSNLKRKASLLRKKINIDTSVSQKSRQSTRSPSAKRLDPSAFTGTGLKKFICQSPKSVQDSDVCSANQVYCLNPNSGFQKFTSSRRSGTNEKGNSAQSAILAGLQNLQSVGRDISESQKEGHILHQQTTGSAWLENMVGNMMSVRKSVKFRRGMPSSNNEPLMLRQSANLKMTHTSSFTSTEGMQQSFMERTGPGPANITIEEIAENATVNKSRKFEVGSIMSNLNSMNIPRKIEANQADRAIPKLSKVITKILLKELIAFRFDVKSLSRLCGSAEFPKEGSLKPILLQISNFFNKARLVSSAVGQALSFDLQQDLKASLKEELAHGGCLNAVNAIVLKLLGDKEDNLTRSRRYIELKLVHQIHLNSAAILSAEFKNLSKAEYSQKTPIPPERLAFKPRLVIPSNQYTKPSMLRAPIKKASIISNARQEFSSSRGQIKDSEKSSDDSVDSLNLKMDLLRVNQISPKMMVVANSEEKAKQSMRVSRRNLLDNQQLPMKHFISDHDKGLKNLENKITSFRTSAQIDFGNSGLTATQSSSLSKKNIHVPATFGSLASRKVKTKLI